MYSNITGTGSQVTLGFPHSQICLRVASPKVREHGRMTPIAYELASDTYYGLGVVTQCHHQYRACNLDPLSHVSLDCSDEAKIHIVPYKSRTSHFNAMTISLGTSYTPEVLLGMKAVSILIFPWSTFVKACLLGCQKLTDG